MTKSYKKYLSDDDALDRLKKYCAYQERCHQEVKTKMFELGVYGDIQDEIISDLISENYLNETRFATSYVRGKFRFKKWSKGKIRMELKRRKISAYNMKKGFEEIDEEEYEDNIQRLLIKKKRTLTKEDTFTAKRKLSNYMLQKGYTYEEFRPFIDLVNEDE